MNHFTSLTVLSIEQATTLPYMTLRLAQEGMRVIRVENPPRGDPNRWVGPPVLPAQSQDGGFETGMNAYYLPNNMGKESITLNLGTPEGKEILHRLVVELPVDVFATNQRPRAYEKLGIDENTLRALKPDLIWVGITGFGPDSDEAAYDPIIQARAGYMDITGEPDGPPLIFGLPMVDLGAGEHGYGQVMKALYHRSITGQGGRIDLSLYRSAITWMVSPVMLAHNFNVAVKRHGNTHQFFAPASTFPTQEGFVYLAVGNDRQWQAITALPGFELLARPEYVHNSGRIASVARLNADLALITRTKSTAELLELFQSIGVPIAVVNTISNLCAELVSQGDLVWARDYRSGVEIAIPPPPVPTLYLQAEGMSLRFPPRLGEHNRTLLESLGLPAEELEAKGIL